MTDPTVTAVSADEAIRLVDWVRGYIPVRTSGLDDACMKIKEALRARPALADVGECETQDVSKLLADLDESVAFFEKEALYETENMGAGGSQIALNRWRRFIAATWEARCFVAEHGPNWRSLGTGKQPRPAAAKGTDSRCEVCNGSGPCPSCNPPSYSQPPSPAAHTAQKDAKAMRCYYVTAHTQGFVKSPLWHELAEETRETYRQHVSRLAEQGSGGDST